MSDPVKVEFYLYTGFARDTHKRTETFDRDEWDETSEEERVEMAWDALNDRIEWGYRVKDNES